MRLAREDRLALRTFVGWLFLFAGILLLGTFLAPDQFGRKTPLWVLALLAVVTGAFVLDVSRPARRENDE